LERQKIVRELILNFHGIGEPYALVDPEEKRYWWNRTSFSHLLDQIIARPQDISPRISITFDDGNASDVLFALPELAKRGLVASFFVCAGRIGMRYFLDKSMINDLLDAGMSIGSHGMNHRDWRRLDAQALDVEIGEARRKLEDITHRPITTVAIPFGSYDRRVLSRLKRDPWDCIYTSDRGLTHVTAKIKPRETLASNMQDCNILRQLMMVPLPHVRIQRSLSQLFKRWR
jgi:peptidoglycan/xylan/chitin deacetylase (PgdA/CDA1 family)